MQAPWTEAEAAALKRLREQALLTPAAFAKRHALSNGQLRELEQGGQGSFYSEDIKAYNGRKLLKALGYVAPVEPEPEPEPVPPPPPAADDGVDAVAPTEAMAQAAPPADDAAPAPLDTDPAPAAPADPAPAEAPPEPAPEPPPAASSRSGTSAWLLAALALVAAVGVLWVTSDARRPAPAATPTTTPALPAASAPEAEPAGVPAPAAPPASAPASAQAQAQPARGSAACEPVAGSPVTAYQSPVADRPDTYVHIESQQDARVCVVDAQNRSTQLNLQAGQSNTIYGTAPFVIRSGQWPQLKVYFQGMRVQVEAGQPTEQVLLQPRRGA